MSFIQAYKPEDAEALTEQEAYYNGNNQSMGMNTMINDEVKAAEQNMASVINNLVNQVEAETGMAVRSITVNRPFSGENRMLFRAEIALEVKK